MAFLRASFPNLLSTLYLPHPWNPQTQSPETRAPAHASAREKGGVGDGDGDGWRWQATWQWWLKQAREIKAWNPDPHESEWECVYARAAKAMAGDGSETGEGSG